MVPAPGRFSTTTCCPRYSDTFGATARAVMSVPPPGADGTTKRIAREGYGACAPAEALQTSVHNMEYVVKYAASRFISPLRHGTHGIYSALHQGGFHG